MNEKSITNWLEILSDELPAVIKPFFLLSIFLIIILFAGKTLGLNNSFWFINQEQIFNLAFYIGLFSLVYRALSRAPLEYKKMVFRKKYSEKAVNKKYFLGKYDKWNNVFVFELVGNKRKLWVKNPQTRRGLWPNAKYESLDTELSLENKIIDLSKYPKNLKNDGEIDITKLTTKDNLWLLFLSLAIIFIPALLGFARDLSTSVCQIIVK